MTSCVQKTNLVTMAEDWRAVRQSRRNETEISSVRACKNRGSVQTEKSVGESENRYDKLCAENKSGYDGGGVESSETKS